MGDLLSVIVSTPIPTILVIGGMFFIFLGFGGRINTGQIPPETRKYFGTAGILFIVVGVMLFVVPQRSNNTANPSTQSSPESNGVGETSVPSEVPQSEYDRIALTVSALNQVSEVIYGPQSGSITSEDDDKLECIRTERLIKNSIIGIEFDHPALDKSWAFGITFRDVGTNQEYRLFINDEAVWKSQWLRVNSEGSSISTTIGGGQLTNLLQSAGAANEIKLFADDNSALFYVNEKYIAQFDIPQITSPGDVNVCVDFENKRATEGLSIRYAEFTVWSLP
jgi:hypothetical protein